MAPAVAVAADEVGAVSGGGLVELLLGRRDDVLVTDSQAHPAAELLDADTPLALLERALLQAGLDDGEALAVRLHSSLLGGVEVLYLDFGALHRFTESVHVRIR